MPDLALIRFAIALVWLYQGLWCKLLGRCPGHRAIVQAVPGLSGGAGMVVLAGLGTVETGLAVSGPNCMGNLAAPARMMTIPMISSGMVTSMCGTLSRKIFLIAGFRMAASAPLVLAVITMQTAAMVSAPHCRPK